jgi:hypothetical protein
MRYIVTVFLVLGVASTALIQPADAADRKGKGPHVAAQAPAPQTRGGNKGDCGHDFHLCPR